VRKAARDFSSWFFTLRRGLEVSTGVAPNKPNASVPVAASGSSCVPVVGGEKRHSAAWRNRGNGTDEGQTAFTKDSLTIVA
jgi:hypothetical protein